MPEQAPSANFRPLGLDRCNLQTARPSGSLLVVIVRKSVRGVSLYRVDKYLIQVCSRCPVNISRYRTRYISGGLYKVPEVA